MIGIKDFTKETLEDMKSITRKTRDVEIGFVFCRGNDDKIKSGQPICVGKSCEVDIRKSKCKSKDQNIGFFHTHPTNDSVSTQDLVMAHDKDVMCLGRKTLNPFLPFNNRIDCYTVIDKESKKYANEVLEDLNKIETDTWSKVGNNQISSQEAHKIMNSEYDKHVKKLLPLFRTFKV